MKIKEVTKDLKSLTDFICKGAEGKVNLTEDEAMELDKAVLNVFRAASDSDIIASVEKVANMDILRMNIHFFDHLPNVWGVYQNAAEISVKFEEQQ